MARIPIAALVGFLLALLLFATVGVGQARAQVADYTVSDWAGCGGGYSAGSYDKAGNLYVPCTAPGSAKYSNSTIYRVAEDGTRTPVTAELGFHVTDVAPSPDGSFLYVTKAAMVADPINDWDYAKTADRLKRVSPNSYVEDTDWAFSTYGFSGAQYPAQGMHIATDSHADGTYNIYLASGGWTLDGNMTVAKYRSNGTWTGVTLGRAAGDKTLSSSWDKGVYYYQLNGLTVSPDGNRVYTVETGNNRVQRWVKAAGTSETTAYTANGTFGGKYKPDYRDANGVSKPHVDRDGNCQSSWNATSTFSAPYDVALTTEGGVEYLYVMNTTCNQVMKFDASKEFVTAGTGFIGAAQVGAPQVQPLPHGFAVSAKGNVFVAQSGKKWTRPTVNPVAPTVSITSGPAAGSTHSDTTPTFAFTSNQAGTTFQCKFDTGTYANCTSPHTSPTALSTGQQHTFYVKGTNNNLSGEDSRTWTVGNTGETCDPTVNTGTGTPRNGDPTANIMTGDASHENFCGLGGDDTISPAGGNDKIDGGSGNDTLSYAGFAGGISVHLAPYGSTNGAPDAWDSNGSAGIGYDKPLIGIENLTGSNGPDGLYGNAGNNTFTGGPGADSFFGYEGNDILNTRDGVVDAIINCGDGLGDKAIVDASEASKAVGCETVDSGSTVIDNEEPTNGTISVTGSAGSNPGYTRARQVSLKLSATDNVGVTRVSIADNDGIWDTEVPYSTNMSYTLPSIQGTNYISVRFHDAAGNMTDPIKTSIKLDTVAPVVIKTEPAGTTVSRGTALVAHFADTDLKPSTVNSTSYYMRKDGTTTNIPMKSYSYSTDRNRAIMWPSVALLANTPYTVYINSRMTDEAGNPIKDQNASVAGYQMKRWSFRTGG